MDQVLLKRIEDLKKEKEEVKKRCDSAIYKAFEELKAYRRSLIKEEGFAVCYNCGEFVPVRYGETSHEWNDSFSGGYRCDRPTK